jgi:vanillate O-demethylase monooxygenase subunit
MIQNLMDLTHLAYVHADSIGGDPADHAADKVEVARTPTGIRFVREMRSVTAPGRYVARFGRADRLDRWSELEYVAPAVVRQNSGWGRIGCEVIERRQGALRDKMLHAITPATEDSSYYFYDAADGAEPDPARATEGLSGLRKIILEDVAMVEAQQVRLEGVDPRKLLAIRSDRARLMMMQELDRRCEEESRRGMTARRRPDCSGKARTRCWTR